MVINKHKSIFTSQQSSREKNLKKVDQDLVTNSIIYSHPKLEIN